MPPASRVSGLWPQLAPIIFLGCSNVFMTIAWYGHLKFKSIPLVTVVLVSWDRLCGVLLRSACQPHRQRRLFTGGAQDHPGGYLPHRVRRVDRGLFRGIAEPYAERRLCPDRARRSTGVSRAGLTGAATTEPPDGLPPTGGRRLRSDASEQVADRQDDVGYDGDPEGVAADEWDCHERSDDGQNGQHHRDDEHRGGWR